jgi:formate dehydrogenase maturation protein FdhE
MNDAIIQSKLLSTSAAPRYVHHRRPRCPICGSTGLRSYKSLRNGDTSVSRYVACRGCGCKFILVVE